MLGWLRVLNDIDHHFRSFALRGVTLHGSGRWESRGNKEFLRRTLDVLKLMTWNIFMGCRHHPGRLLEVIKSENPDILFMQECVGWHGSARAGEVAAAMGIGTDDRHLALGPCVKHQETAYDQYAFSRLPFRSTRPHNRKDSVAHCILEVEVEWRGAPLTLFGMHLGSGCGEDLRRKELQYFQDEVLQDRDPASACMAVMGDLNALSNRDPYPDELGKHLSEEGVRKYGNPARFDVTRALEVQGWSDALALRNSGRTWVTAPNRIGYVKGGASPDFRTDYIFVSPPLLSTVVDSRVAEGRGASDHEPVVVRLA